MDVSVKKKKTTKWNKTKRSNKPHLWNYRSAVAHF